MHAFGNLMRWAMAAALLVAMIALPGGCTDDRKQINDHQRVLDSEKD